MEFNGYIDESGSYGFNFANHNTHLVVTAVLVEKGEKTKILEECINQIRDEIFNGAELKSSRLKDKTRHRVFNRLRDLDFKFFSLIVDKRNIFDDSGLRNWKESFYKFLYKQLYTKLFNTFPNLNIYADELIDKVFLDGFQKYLLNHTQNTLFQQIRFAKSDDSQIIQLADIICGSINRNVTGKSIFDLNDYVNKQNAGHMYCPHTHQKYFTEYFDSGDYSQEIFDLSLHRADLFLEKYQHSDDPEVKLKVKFVEYLKEVLLYRDPGEYVNRPEIIDNISVGSPINITEYFFKSKIVAPLRDEDVLIASNRNGYKLPASQKDIVEFFDLFFANIDPMIRRIRSCYESIALVTDNKIDFLDESRYSYLKTVILSLEDIDKS